MESENSEWRLDRDYYIQLIGSKHAIQTSTNYSYNPNVPQIQIIDTQSVSVLVDGGMRVNPDQIMKFETLTQAEEYLVKTFSSAQGYFYSIRKIYF
jgi:hypothetical protein